MKWRVMIAVVPVSNVLTFFEFCWFLIVLGQGVAVVEVFVFFLFEVCEVSEFCRFLRFLRFLRILRFLSFGEI